MSFTGRFPPDFNKEYDLPEHAGLPRNTPEYLEELAEQLQDEEEDEEH